MIEASPRRLLVFKTVVDQGGFNAAAEKLGIAQPSVGAHVKALERQAGHALLTRRRGARPEPTEAGRIVYDMAVEVVRLSGEAAARLVAINERRTREIVIAAHRDLAISFLPPCLELFSRRNARSRVVTRIGTIEEVLALVESGAARVGVLLTSQPIRGLRSEIVGREPLRLVVGRGHPLARAGRIGPADIRRFPFVVPLRDSRFFRIVDGALRAFGLDRYEIAMELQESVSVREALRHGESIACLPGCACAVDVEGGALVALDLVKPLPSLQIRCVYRDAPDSAARRFIDLLRG